MKPKKGRNDARDFGARTRYNPEKNPYPTRKDFEATGNPLPVGNSRQQRRARAKLSFAEQAKCAQSVGFEAPTRSRDVMSVEEAVHWIARWEAGYAKL